MILEESCKFYSMVSLYIITLSIKLDTKSVSPKNIIENILLKGLENFIALNSTSMLLQATTCCFLLRHVIKFPHTYEQYPEVDLLSVTDTAQSISVNISTSLLAVFPKNNPFLGIIFKYHIIRFAAFKYSSVGLFMN